MLAGEAGWIARWEGLISSEAQVEALTSLLTSHGLVPIARRPSPHRSPAQTPRQPCAYRRCLYGEFFSHSSECFLAEPRAPVPRCPPLQQIEAELRSLPSLKARMVDVQLAGRCQLVLHDDVVTLSHPLLPPTLPHPRAPDTTPPPRRPPSAYFAKRECESRSHNAAPSPPPLGLRPPPAAILLLCTAALRGGGLLTRLAHLHLACANAARRHGQPPALPSRRRDGPSPTCAAARQRHRHLARPPTAFPQSVRLTTSLPLHAAV